MFSFPKGMGREQNKKSNIKQPFLDIDQLNCLRTLAEQLNCSPVSTHALDSRQAGHLATRALGSGIDYAESRVYQPGDDPRSINWRLSARSTETFVKTYHIESRPTMSILLDQRRAMIFGTRGRLKFVQALRMAALLGFASDYHQLNFQGWIIDDNKISYHDNFSAFLLHANRPPMRLPTTSTKKSNQENKTDLASLLQEIHLRSAKGSLVYLLSDFNHIDKTFQSHLAQLSEESFVQALHIVDIAEIDLPTLGKLRLQQLNHDNSYQINTHSHKEQQLFSQRAATDLKEKKRFINNAGAAYKQLLTDEENIQNYISLPLGQS